MADLRDRASGLHDTYFLGVYPIPDIPVVVAGQRTTAPGITVGSAVLLGMLPDDDAEVDVLSTAIHELSHAVPVLNFPYANELYHQCPALPDACTLDYWGLDT